MRTESFITSYFGIGMISLYHIIVYNNRKSTSHYLIVYHRYYLPFRKNSDKRFYLLVCPKHILIRIHPLE